MKNFEITKEQVLELSKNNAIEYQLKQWFPEAFKTELEVGKWYKDCDQPMFFYFVLEIKDSNNINAYGFDVDGNYMESLGLYEWGTPNYFKEATEQEVETVLKNEAIRRGFKKGLFIDKLLPFNMGTDKKGIDKKQLESNDFYLSNDRFFCGNLMLMNHDGQWVTIIETITKEEAEKLLNKKIV